MKKLFTYKSASAFLTQESPTRAKLTSVYSKQRSQGHATELLRQICEYADAKKLDIYLVARRYGYADNESPTTSMLISWYKKFDFRNYNENGTSLYRPSHELNGLL